MTTISLEALMEAIHKQYPDEPLEQLTAAVLSGQHLEATADDLVGHFVVEARAQGATWSEIGGCLGVTKQAAQKRFTPKQSQNVFTRFTDDARRVIMLAQEHARDLRHSEIEPEHLLLGLLDLTDVPPLPEGVSAASLREVARQSLPPATGEPPVLIPYSGRSRRVLEETVRTADDRQADAVGTEHLLTALEADPAWARLTQG